MDTAVVRWTRNRQFVGVDGYGHSIVMDAQPQYKGEGSGMRPIEVVLHGLAACTGMDIISILEKKRQDVRGLEIRVDAWQREDEYPRSYTRMELEYVVTGYGISSEAVARAIELSDEKYCSVGGMLKGSVEIKTSFRVVEAALPGAVLEADEGGRHE